MPRIPMCPFFIVLLPCVAPRQRAETDLGPGDAQQLGAKEQGPGGYRPAELRADLGQ